METWHLPAPASRSPLALAGEELHPLLRFWRSAYAPFGRPLELGLGFHVPAFPGPLSSPIFALAPRAAFLAANRGLLSHFNEIVPLGHDQRGPAPVGFQLTKQFFLGRKKLTGPAALPEGYGVEVLGLSAAAQRPALWRLLTDGFPREAPLLRAQLPFLAGLPAEFRVAFLQEGGEPVGVVIVGVADGLALVLNETILLDERGRGLGRLLCDAARNLAFRMGAFEAFFYTEFPHLGAHADVVEHYRVFERV